MQRARCLALAVLLLAGMPSAPVLAAGGPQGFHLGITVEHVPDGLLVNHVQPDSPSSRAGLVAGDLIVAMDGRKARALTPEEIDATFSATYQNPISVTIRRGNAAKVEIRVGP